MKAHLKSSDEPIVAGRQVSANCGAEVSNSSFVFMWDRDFVRIDKSCWLPNLCRKCLEMETPPERYVYGIVNAQELLTSDTDHDPAEI